MMILPQPAEILCYSDPNNMPGFKFGTLRQYITDRYQPYAALGLFTWEAILKHLRGE